MVIDNLIGKENEWRETEVGSVFVRAVYIYVVIEDIVATRQCHAGENCQRDGFYLVGIKKFHGRLGLEGYVNVEVKAAQGGDTVVVDTHSTGTVHCAWHYLRVTAGVLGEQEQVAAGKRCAQTLDGVA